MEIPTTKPPMIMKMFTDVMLENPESKWHIFKKLEAKITNSMSAAEFNNQKTKDILLLHKVITGHVRKGFRLDLLFKTVIAALKNAFPMRKAIIEKIEQSAMTGVIAKDLAMLGCILAIVINQDLPINETFFHHGSTSNLPKSIESNTVLNKDYVMLKPFGEGQAYVTYSWRDYLAFILMQTAKWIGDIETISTNEQQFHHGCIFFVYLVCLFEYVYQTSPNVCYTSTQETKL